MKKLLFCLSVITCICCTAGYGWYPSQPDQSLLPQIGYSTIIGRNLTYQARQGDTLIELARQSGLGYLALTRANPDTDPWLPPEGKKILLPYAFLLPAGIQPGITVNLAELRLYYVWEEPHGLRVRVYPVGIGRSGWDTPEGTFVVVEKIVHPAWHPPASIRREKPQLPASIPPGPDNPLGDYWIGLSTPGYGIHGTNKPYGVGRRISHGCMRLYPWDIRDLYARVKTGTAVRILRQSVKIAHQDGQLLMEVHRPDNANDHDLREEALQQIAQLPWQGQLDLEALEKEIHLGRGVPVILSRE